MFQATRSSIISLGVVVCLSVCLHFLFCLVQKVFKRVRVNVICGCQQLESECSEGRSKKEGAILLVQ